MVAENDRIIVSQINDHIYLFDDNHEATGYLVVGKNKAMVIDTMIGYANVAEVSRRYTDLPLMVVNTHGHPDHIYGNIYFDEAYMHPDDWYVATEAYMDEEFLTPVKAAGFKIPPFKDINDGDVIDLGGIHIKVVQLPGHTPGSVLLLSQEDRILFTGDAVNHHLWMQLHHCTSLKICADNFKKVQYLKDEADYILHGHATGLDDISLLEKNLLAIEEILAGNTDGDEPYHWFGGIGCTHPIPNDDGVICFNPITDKVKENRKNWAQSDAKRDAGLVEPDDIKKFRNISYNLFGESSLLDVYMPTEFDASKGDSKLPVLVNIHGGGYFYGDKELYRFYAMDMAKYGFAVVNINYRLSPEYSFPSPLQDINEVLRWIEKNADEYGMDTDRVFMMGDSAGAQLTSHYAAINSNPEFAALYALKETSIKLKGISLACGMYDIPAELNAIEVDGFLHDYLSEFDNPKYKELDVLGAITKDYPPTFIFSCPNDFLYEKCEPMAKLINERGGKATMKIYGTKEMKDIAHVFHCNMYSKIGADARKDQAEFLLSL